MTTTSQIEYALEKHASVNPEDLTQSDLREAGCLERVCVLPAELNERLSYLANVLVQATTRHPNDDKLRMTVGTLCQAMTYLFNSASWREGELHDFDAEEIRRKLQRIRG